LGTSKRLRTVPGRARLCTDGFVHPVGPDGSSSATLANTRELKMGGSSLGRYPCADKRFTEWPLPGATTLSVACLPHPQVSRTIEPPSGVAQPVLTCGHPSVGWFGENRDGVSPELGLPEGLAVMPRLPEGRRQPEMGVEWRGSGTVDFPHDTYARGICFPREVPMPAYVLPQVAPAAFRGGRTAGPHLLVGRPGDRR
jgi:hypothetical protein